MKSRYFIELSVATFLLLFFLYPLTNLSYETLSVKSSTSFLNLLSSSHYQKLIINSLRLSATATLIAVILGLTYTVITSLFTFPGKSFFTTFIIIPLALPPFIGGLGFLKIFGRGGTIPLTLYYLGFTDKPIALLPPGSNFTVALLQALHFFPLVTLITSAAIRSIDQDLIDAAWLNGSISTAVRRVILPLLLPSLIGATTLAFMGSLADIGTPLLLNVRDLISVQIFDQYTDAAESGTGLMLLSLLTLLSIFLFILSGRFAKRFDKLDKARGANRSLRSFSLNTYQGTFVDLLLGTLLLLTLLPHLTVIIFALSEKWVLTPLPTAFTLNHFYEALGNEVILRSLSISGVLAVIAATLTLIIALSILTFKREGSMVSTYLELACQSSLIIPGIVLAFSYLTTFKGTLLDPFVNPLYLLVFAYSVRKLPFMLNTLTGSFLTLNRQYEEAGLIFGSSKCSVFISITLPLLRRVIIVGILFIFIFSFLEVSDSLVLAREEKYYPVAKTLYELSKRPDGPASLCALSALIILFTTPLILLAKRLQ
jgi:iron(III) transport system permease protein